MHTRGIYAPYTSWQGPDRHAQHHSTRSSRDQRCLDSAPPVARPPTFPSSKQDLNHLRTSDPVHRLKPCIPAPSCIERIERIEHSVARRYSSFGPSKHPRLSRAPSTALARAGWHERRHAGVEPPITTAGSRAVSEHRERAGTLVGGQEPGWSLGRLPVQHFNPASKRFLRQVPTALVAGHTVS
ncbi:hypothetical protein P171DRAFT_245659 [Karstenula rhodostoma CBS 690.94]|uniref:Uncharacterized protein n=1 Tax=Karstenula rhodostoma CBS 690.94 TaxID=1392251 RepID=A0A9P4PN72_9PLEO|nr:hypothetical protein P171DRAFT_245659 [Karstenula rhodostoma CBS 690.94]